MPPKKAQKMSLNEFLGDSNYGSWADEMDNFPTAPALKADDGFRGSALSRAPDRSDTSRYPPREEVPLPTQPPYTAFVGNLPFDLTESELEQHFDPHKTKSVKIIKDRDDKPKGFGYVEFETLDGLQGALDKSGSNLAGRMIRTSVAEPPKEREKSGFGDRGFDDDRQWRRDGPLPPSDRPDRGSFGGERRGSRFDESHEPRGGFGSKFQPREDRPPPPQSIAEEVTDWRSMAKPPAPPPSRGPPAHSGLGERRGSNFGQNLSNERAERDAALSNHPSETEEKWSIGTKFKPAPPERENSGSSFGKKFHNGRPGFGERGQSGGDSGHGSPTPITTSLSDDNIDWRAGPRKITPSSGPVSRQGSQESPGAGGPPMRRKIELLPRSSNPSAVSSPLASPKDGSTAKPTLKANPFGDAKPVNAAAREREIAEKVERQRSVSGQGNTSWGNSRTGSRHTSRAPSEVGDIAPPPRQILSRETEPDTATPASTSDPLPPKEKEREKFGSRAPPPPPLNKSGAPAGERRTSTSGPSAGGLKASFSFAKVAGGGSGGGGSGAGGADAPGAWTRKGSVAE